MTTEQLKSGHAYEVIKKVASIIILDWPITGNESSAYHHRFRLFDEMTGYSFPDLFEINTLELPKLPHQPDGTNLYNWLSFLTAKTEEEFTMIAKTCPEIAQAVAVIMELSADEQTRMLAEAREKYRRDEIARRKLARQEGLQEGLLTAAKNLLRLKMAHEFISESTGLSFEEIKALAEKLPFDN
ncbi:MAG: Rpn family recombination-promoting nuclease/putative transposase [Fibromonadales bacterium]|nr:Rpn family recombination-promoting nuclease/putative transposase [Fibromonadales bacterium]